LGIINLRTQNTALLLKLLHKFYNKLDSFWWRDIMSLSTNYFMIASCLVKKRYISFLAGLMGSWCSEMEIPTAFSFSRRKILLV
jgi:hypothetical protein